MQVSRDSSATQEYALHAADICDEQARSPLLTRGQNRNGVVLSTCSFNKICGDQAEKMMAATEMFWGQDELQTKHSSIQNQRDLAKVQPCSRWVQG